VDSLISQNLSGVPGGGGIYGRNFDVVGSTIADNSAPAHGGGIIGEDFVVADSLLAGNNVGDPLLPNSGEGGAIYVFGEASVTNSVITTNAAQVLGGGIFNRGILTMSAVTLSANRSGGYGGGISNGNDDPFGGPPASLSVVNVTLSGNEATVGGGGISNGGTPSLATIEAQNITVAQNIAPTASSIMARDADPIEIANSLLVSSAVPNCEGPIVSGGHNLATDASCGLGASGDLVAAIIVEPLADNGGKTPTHAVPLDSLAIDAASDAVCPGVDQRGFVRPFDGNGDGVPQCDIGSFESSEASSTQSPAPTPVKLPSTGEIGSQDGSVQARIDSILSVSLPAAAFWAVIVGIVARLRRRA
jgi:hypothetical protein